MRWHVCAQCWEVCAYTAQYKTTGLDAFTDVMLLHTYDVAESTGDDERD